MPDHIPAWEMERLRRLIADRLAREVRRRSSGPVFRSVARGGRIGTEALSPYAASLVIKQRIAAVGLDPRHLFRPQPALGLPDQRSRGGGVAVQADRGQPPQVTGHAAWLCPAGRPIQGARGGGVNSTA
jgi:hypothetical protein